MMESFLHNLQPHLDVLDSLFQSIVPEAIVQPESNELQRGLGTKRVFCRHVEVIHEVDQLLTANWYINTLIDTRYTDQNANLTTIKTVIQNVVMFEVRPQLFEGWITLSTG